MDSFIQVSYFIVKTQFNTNNYYFLDNQLI